MKDLTNTEGKTWNLKYKLNTRGNETQVREHGGQAGSRMDDETKRINRDDSRQNTGGGDDKKTRKPSEERN